MRTNGKPRGTRETDRRGADEPIDRWVRPPGHSAAELAATDFQSLRSEPPAAAPLGPDEHAETRESVSEYIDRLLGRVRERSGETNAPDDAELEQPSQQKEASAESDFAQSPEVPCERSQTGRRRKR